MKIHPFACPECGHRFRRILSEPTPSSLACPLCGAPAAAAPADSAAQPRPRVEQGPRRPPQTVAALGCGASDDDEEP